MLKAREAIGQASDAAGLAQARGELSEALVDFVATASDPVGLDAGKNSDAVPAPALTLSFPSDGRDAELAQDEDMRDVFLEEAREVLLDAHGAHAELSHQPGELALLTTLRRDFHTLKGSSRMVGLTDFGEAAWACEQLYNTHLADQLPASPALLEFTDWALRYIGAWVEEIHARAAVSHDSATLIAQARRVSDDDGEPAEPDPSVDALEADGVGFVLPAGLNDAVMSADEASPPLTFHADWLEPDGEQPLAASISRTAPLDLSVAALQAPFDATATLPLPVLEMAAPPPPLSDHDVIDLDLELAVPDQEPPDSIYSYVVPSPAAGAFAAESLVTPAAPEREPPEFPAQGAQVTAVPAPQLGDSPAPQPHDAPAVPPGLDAGSGFEDEQVKVVGPLRIGIPLFNIYLNEADELSRRLSTELAEWAMELHRPLGETPIALAHSLAGSSATVGFTDLSQLARSLEHAQARSHSIGQGTAEEARLFVDAAEEIRRLLHQFAAGFLRVPSPELLERLAQHELSSALRLEAAVAEADHPAQALDVDLDLQLADGQDVGLGPQEEDAADDGPDTRPAPAPQVELRPHEVFESAPQTDAVRSLEPEAVAGPLTPPVPAPEPEPPVLPQPDVVPSAEAPPSTRGELSDSVFDLHDSRFNALGLGELKPLGERPVETQRAMAPTRALVDADDTIDAVDAVDDELFPIFEEEAQELLPQLATRLRDWTKQPTELNHPGACMRTLHTLKGAARLAGAMRLGEMAHRLESRIERLLSQPPVHAQDVEALQSQADVLSQTFDTLRKGEVADDHTPVAPTVASPDAGPAPALATLLDAAPDESVASGWQPLAVASAGASGADVSGASAGEPPVHPTAESGGEPEPTTATESASPAGAGAAPPAIDWSRFAPTLPFARKAADRTLNAQSAVRVRAPLLDRLVNQAGEVSITRSRIESGIVQIKTSLIDLTENLERLRAQLRDIEFHGEVQMTSRLEAAKAAAQTFDPLEFDRFTRFQELTRMMAESVNDVATVQRSLQRSLEVTEDELVAQSRMTRELQDDLLRTRMVEFEGLSDRLYRVVRQAAKETGKSVRLDIVGGSIEVDRGVLDRMTGSFEHLLRNCVSHGIESPEERTAAGKDATGSIVVSLSQEGNEVSVEFRDDGGGLNLARIRDKGVAMGLIDPHGAVSDAELANLIFSPGFSTAQTVTELSGRGIGMDVVRSEVNAMGGRVETATAAGQGTAFKLILPLTTAVTQVVMLRCGDSSVAVPSTLVEVVRRSALAEVEQAYASGAYPLGERTVPFFWLGALLQTNPRSTEPAGRTCSVVVIRSAQQRIALHVDEVLGNQEVVVKNLGPQLSRLPGLTGVTLLASGAVALIYNPVALATLYGESARQATLAARQAPVNRVPETPSAAPVSASQAPLIMVVDDSLTVRRVTQRLLLREGYRVVLAKDGLDALERLAEAVPNVVLSDIEMPRMDGFDLVRNMRADARLRNLPVIMITSRIAQKHRDYASELGVDHYLGKPYSEEDLLALISGYTRNLVAA